MQLEVFGGQFISLKNSRGIRIRQMAFTFLFLSFCLGAVVVYDISRRSANLSLALPTAAANSNLEIVTPVVPLIPTVEVLVPVSDIDSGTTLLPQMFTLKSLASDFVPVDALRSMDKIEGKISVRKIPGGSLTLDRDVSSSHENFAFELPLGSRAVTINLNSQTSVEGHAKPGSVVDVNFVFKNEKGENTITTLVHNAKIASVNGITSPSEFIPSRGNFPVTLVVSERDSKAIRLAYESGSISLALVGTPEAVVPDPRTETFSLSSLSKNPAEEEEKESFSTTPHLVRIQAENGTPEKILITNRRVGTAK